MSTLTALLLAATVDPEVAACLDDDVGACLRLAERAIARDDAEGRAEAMQWLERACGLESSAGCGRWADLLEERNPDTAAWLRERAARLAVTVVQAPPRLETDPPMVAAELPPVERMPDGERWGVLGTIGGYGSNTREGGGAFVGLGARLGLVERYDQAKFVPAVAVVAGADVWALGWRPWLEARLELMSAPPGGLLHSQAELFFSLGATWFLAGQASVRPYLAFGGGLNWVRDLATMFQDAMRNFTRDWYRVGGIPLYWLSSPFWLPLLLAGRAEVRVTIPLKPSEPVLVAGMFGVGF